VRGIVNVVLGTGRVFDEDGQPVDLRFVETDPPPANCALVDGVLHRCEKFDLFGGLLNFWVEPVDVAFHGSTTTRIQ
jgi:hypothetical protein